MTYDVIKISGVPEITTPSESTDIVLGDGNYLKRIKYNTVKNDMVGTSPTYTTDTEPYLMRQTAHTGVVGKCALNKLVGGSLGWNQLCNGSSVTVPSGHKYYMKKSGTASIGASTGSAITGLASGTDMVIDLTAMFGSTIADYVYSLESSSSGSGVAWLRKYIDIDSYHAYDAGSIQSVQATAHVTTGFNAWDEAWEVGRYNWSTGAPYADSTRIRSKNYIPILPNTTYYCQVPNNVNVDCYFYDGNKSFVSPVAIISTRTFTTPANARYMQFSPYAAYGTSYNNDICINISKPTGSPKNGDYVAYSGHIYPLGSDTLRGVPQLVSNKLVFDGDIKTPDGTITRKYGIVDMGTLNWGYSDSQYGGALYANMPTEVADGVLGGLSSVCARYALFQGTADGFSTKDKVFTLCNRYITSLKRIQLKDSAYTDAATFKTAMSGVYLVYELATPTTESSTAYQKIQTIDADGTESFTVSSPVPVGHETQTPDNILAALGWLGE